MLAAATILAAAVGHLLGGCAAGGLDTPVSAQAGRQPGAAAPAGLDRARPEERARVALLLPLSAEGHAGIVAKALKQAAELALFERDNPRFQLSVKDTKGTPEGARIAADEALKDGSELILGPLYAKSVEAVAPLARQGNVPVIALSNDARVAGGGVYLLSFLPEQDVERIVSFAASQGKRRFAALVSDDDYGRIMSRYFSAQVARSGGSVMRVESYPPGANGMLERSQALIEAIQGADEAGAPVDALFVPGGAELLPGIAPMLAYGKLDTTRLQLLGSGGWDYANVGREPALIGGWFPAPDPQGWRAFQDRFGRSFGAAPPRTASLAYDAVAIALELSGQPRGTRFTRATIERPNGFSGVDGALRFRSDGMSERGLAVLEVQKIGTSVVDPAPASLSAAQLTQAPQPSVR